MSGHCFTNKGTWFVFLKQKQKHKTNNEKMQHLRGEKNKFRDIGLEVAWGKKYVQEWKICSDVLLTLDHGNTDNMIATRIAQLRLCHSFAHPQVDCACQHELLCANLNHSMESVPTPTTKSFSSSRIPTHLGSNSVIIPIRLVILVRRACDVPATFWFLFPLLDRWFLAPGTAFYSWSSVEASS